MDFAVVVNVVVEFSVTTIMVHGHI